MLLLENISALLTLYDTNNISLDDDPVVVIDGEKIKFAGSRGSMPSLPISERIDAHHHVVMPGLIDCHAHLMFAGSRADEFTRRMSNESYETIQAKGGGIMSTVMKTRAASDEDLLNAAKRRADMILSSGVTTLESKSGYGLSTLDEVRLLRLTKELHETHLLDLHPTFLGAHVVPKEYREHRETYVSLILDEMLPEIAREKLAVDCDVFCETSAFSLEEARAILSRAHEHGLGLRAHVQQLGINAGGVSLIRDLPLKSISHADFLTDDDIGLLSEHRVVVEALPIAALFLRSTQKTPVDRLKKANVKLAIATDFNPGSAMCHDLMVAARLGVTYFGFTVDDALRAITVNAAHALGRDDIGVIKPGALADVVITNCSSVDEILYDWTKHPVARVWKRGQEVKM